MHLTDPAPCSSPKSPSSKRAGLPALLAAADPGGRTLPPDVAAGVLATIRARYPAGSAIEVSWEQAGDETGVRYHAAFLLPRIHLPP